MISTYFSLRNLILLGFLIRFFFIIYGWHFVYPTIPYLTADSFSYTGAFINLWEKGIYSFDLENNDAYFGRLPCYPFFWGIHYVIFGVKYVYQAVSFTQAVLDTFNIWLIFQIVYKISNKQSALIASLIYATYPFTIVWTTISGTECWGCFLVLSFFYILLCKPQFKYQPVLMGIMLALCFYNREYLAVIAFGPIIYYFDKKDLRTFLVKSSIYTITFLLLYSIWPIRNYLNYHRIIAVKTATTGYDRYAMDIISMRSWIYTWSSEATPIIDIIAYTKDTSIVDKKLFKDSKDYVLFKQLVKKARTCGTGTYYWGHYSKFPSNKQNCNDEIEAGFNYLKHKYQLDFTFKYLTVTPLMNLKKLFFKNNLNNQKLNNSKNILMKTLMSYRSLLLILGIIAIILNYKNKNLWSVCSFTFTLYFFICFIFRQLEMRYILQADLILTCLLAPILIESIYSKFFVRKIIS